MGVNMKNKEINTKIKADITENKSGEEGSTINLTIRAKHIDSNTDMSETFKIVADELTRIDLLEELKNLINNANDIMRQLMEN